MVQKLRRRYCGLGAERVPRTYRRTDGNGPYFLKIMRDAEHCVCGLVVKTRPQCQLGHQLGRQFQYLAQLAENNYFWFSSPAEMVFSRSNRTLCATLPRLCNLLCSAVPRKGGLELHRSSKEQTKRRTECAYTSEVTERRRLHSAHQMPSQS